MRLRQYQPSDCKILTELFYDTVHKINIKDYSVQQVNAWADGNIDLKKWRCAMNSNVL